MNFDVNRLLDLEYLHDLELQLNDNINKIKDNFLEQYDLDKLKEMNKEAIISLFSQHNVDSIDVIQYVESDFIDGDWEFADLFVDDISYSNGLREKLLDNVLKKIDELNNKIALINFGYQKSIDDLTVDLEFINFIIKLLSKRDSLTKENIDSLENLITSVDYSDKDKYKFSYDIVKLLVGKNIVSVDRKSNVDISLFEEELDKVYETSGYKEEYVDKIITPSYSETILSSYKYYKSLFDEVGLGHTLTEVMNDSHDLSSGVNASVTSMSKEDFCVELGALFYSFDEVHKKKRADQDALADVLMDLSILDKLYEEDMECADYKQDLLNEIHEYLELLSSLDMDNIFINKIKNRLTILQSELKHNLINKKRKKEIELEYKNIRSDISKISMMSKQLNILNELCLKIYKISGKFRSKSLNSNMLYAKTNYEALTDLNSRIMEFIEVIKVNGYNKDYDKQIEGFSNECLRYTSLEENKMDNFMNLTGFVLFDFDEDNRPYVVSDLDPSNNKSLIDDAVLQKKINAGFSDYNSLINDLLIYGNPEILRDEGTLPYMDRILTSVFYDKNRNYPSKMVRIRPLRNSLVRFVSQKINLKTNTEIHKQVIDIIQEMLPGVRISLDEDFSLYINFSSALKLNDEDSYNESISRYKRKSPLYNLFIADTEKTRLTSEECDLLRDIIHMTLNAYGELENKNENLKFDIVRQIGGKRSRG